MGNRAIVLIVEEDNAKRLLLRYNKMMGNRAIVPIVEEDKDKRLLYCYHITRRWVTELFFQS